MLEWADVWDVAERKTERVSATDIGFSYRSTRIKGRTDVFIVRAAFDLSRRKPGNQYEGMSPDELRDFRHSKQPAGRTCGSFFKNPEGHSAGALIDRVGLKGHRVGGVEISPKHANFFMADPGASWRDVLELRDVAKARVAENAGIRLEEEVRIVTVT